MNFDTSNHHLALSPEQELVELETFCLDYFENENSDFVDIDEIRQEIMHCAEI